jgi:hypothetical protein
MVPDASSQALDERCPFVTSRSRETRLTGVSGMPRFRGRDNQESFPCGFGFGTTLIRSARDSYTQRKR